MTESEPLLAAFQFADSFLPVGAYAASYGIEEFAARDAVSDADDLQALLTDYLRRQFGPCEIVALSAAHEASAAEDLERVAAADRRQHAATMPAEFRESSTSAGRRLLDLAREITDHEAVYDYATLVDAGDVPGNHAVATGLVAQCEGVPAATARLLAGHAFVVGLLGAAQRLVGVGHTDCQRVLRALRPVISAVCSTHADEGIERIRSFAPRVEVLGMAHERAERRLFVS